MLHKTILSVLAEASRIIQATGHARANSHFKPSMWIRGALRGALLLILLWSPSGVRLTTRPVEPLAAGPAAASLQGTGSCMITPTSGPQGRTSQATLTVGPHSLFLLAAPDTILNGTTVSFQPGGVSFNPTRLTVTGQSGQYTGVLAVGSSATTGPRNITVSILVGGGPTVAAAAAQLIVFTCSQAFTVTAARGSDALQFLRGNGKGQLHSARIIELPGAVTGMVVGEINRADGLVDVVVGIMGPDGPQALVFESPEGALSWEPEVFALPAEATALALGQLDDLSSASWQLALRLK